MGVKGLSRWYEPEPSRSKPLSRQQVRYTVPDTRPNLAIPPNVTRVRYCVYDNVTKKARFEVTKFSIEHPVLAISADEGPQDLPAQYFLPANGFRTLFLMDPCHKEPRDMYWAANESGLWGSILDVTFAVNWESGPFQACAWFQQVKKMADGYLANATEDDALLAFAYEDICKERGWDKDADYGTVQHYKKVLASCSSEELYAAKSKPTKWTRWASLFQSGSIFSTVDTKGSCCFCTGCAPGHFQSRELAYLGS